MQAILKLFMLLVFFQTSSASAENLKILIYNTWGVPFTAWDTWRYEAAIKAIEKMDPDLVLLSEVFTKKAKCDFKSEQYPYQADGGNWIPRIVGSGTRILSKYPFEEHAILTYRACKREDCLSRKGANLVTVELPSGKKLNVVVTHMNNAGGAPTRLSQLKQLESFTEWYADPSAPTLIAGDFNFTPDSNEYRYTSEVMKVKDAWNETHAPDELGYTYDCQTNHYARDYSLKTGDSLFSGRIDYFFHRGEIRSLQTRLEFNDPSRLFSDHYGVWGEFEL